MSPGALKKPLLKLNRLVGHSTAKNHMSKPRIGNTDALDDKEEQREIKEIQKKQIKKLQMEDELQARQSRRSLEESSLRSRDPPDIQARYGVRTSEALDRSAECALSSLASQGAGIGSAVSFTARIHHIRPISANLIFIVFRHQIHTIQGVLEYRESEVSTGFVSWAKHLNTEAIVYVKGRAQAPKEPVKGCSVHDVEILIDMLHVIVEVREHVPVDVYAIDRVEEGDDGQDAHFAVSNRVRMANRISFLRTPTAQSIFRINSAICGIFRSTLEAHDFIEIHTPKLQPAATESGAEVFKVNYFGREAFLAQSPQLAKQLCMSADFGRVFEIGSVFRAENSNTHRHLTEYTSMDLEMVIRRDYHEAMDIIDELLKTIFAQVHQRFRREMDIVRTHFPAEDLVWLEKTPRLTFKEAVELINASGWTDDRGRKASENEDLSTRAEIRLGELVKEKYKTDYFILDKFPRSARPFYTHLDDEDDQFTNSFDIFLRGQEITTGGQRINDPEILASRMKEIGMDADEMDEYMQGFEWGVLPHAGCGIGLERVVFLLLNLQDVRNASLFPRDPKSLPVKQRSEYKLPHPEADTIRYAFEHENGRHHGPQELPQLEKLIANYGDATNTSWLDDRYNLWRHEPTGAAIGYAEDNGYAIIMGNPLCDKRQYQMVIRAFLKDLRKEKDLRPLWILVSADIEEILGAKLGWRSMSCIAEERVQVDSAKQVAKKQRQAEDAGVSIHEVPPGKPVPEELRQRCDRRLEDWKANRQGRQVHITEVLPWIDMEHRRYLWAEDPQGEVVGLVVMHQLSPEHGYQIKFALDFPGSPSGTIESLITQSIQSLAKAGVRNVTFGAGATRHMEIVRNLGPMRAKILSRTYESVVKQLKLVQKSEFREKFGMQEDPVYICYPVLGLGVSGARTLIKFFEDEM